MEAFLEAYPGHKAVDGLYIMNRNNDIVDAMDGYGGTAYQCVVSYTFPILGGITSIHTGGDINLYFRNTDVADYFYTGEEELAEELSKTMANAIVNFCYYGNPSQPGLVWPAYSTEEGATMIFDKESHVGYHHDAELMKLLPNMWSF
jgi:para-nitrobenzyl esterase